MKNIVPASAGLLLALSLCATGAHAQATCSSDGLPQPAAVFERFLSADCEACWSDPATPAPSAASGALVLEWIGPGGAGDDAPLSAAATPDALARLQALGRTAPARTDVHTAAARDARAPGRLRVAHGLPFNDYVGAAISLTPPRGKPRRDVATGPWSFTLLLVESIAAGAEGTPVARHVVRNMLQGSWDARNQLYNKEHSGWQELRPMRIPEGAKPERLRVVGWVQAANGGVGAAAHAGGR